MDYYYNPGDNLSFGGESVKVLIEGLYVFLSVKLYCLSPAYLVPM